MTATANKRFRITYTNPQQKPRIVTGEHFDRSSAFYPVLQMAVGERIERRYHTAGYKRIERIADAS
jgi:hypothetical protein